MKLVIVGGVAGGASAAARARRLSEDAEIVVFERGSDLSFANCGMPYYLGGEITDRGKLLVVTPERLRQRYRLDVRPQTVVEAIDRATQTVRYRHLPTGTVGSECYDRLILATGAAPLRPNIPGLELPNVATLRNLDDMDRIHARLNDQCRSAVIVGGGFIGLELVENLVRRGITCTLLDTNPQVLSPFDPEMTTPLRQELLKHGVTLRLEDTVTGFRASGSQLLVDCRSGTMLTADIAVLGIGVKPENQLAIDAGLPIGPRGGIVVNEHLQTADPHIYAVGDAIQTTDVVFGGETQIPLAGPANRQGRLAAEHIFGRESWYRGTQGTAILRVFSLTAAMTGHAEKSLVRQGRQYRKCYIHPAQHAGYYPGAQAMTLKLLFDPDDGRILGAQGVGGDGVDKRIDVLALAIQAGMTVFDLQEAELAYSPQYGSAKDPINMLGFVGSEMVHAEHVQTTLEAVLEQQRTGTGPWLIDVRLPSEYAAGHLPGAKNIPVDELRERLAEVPRDRPVVTYCQVGMRGYLAQRILKQRGIAAANLSGGYKTYLLYDLPIEK